MAGYLPSTADERQAMLAAIGLSSYEGLYEGVPAELLAYRPNLPAGMSELEAARAMKAMAAKNRVYGRVFRGAGAYAHFVPAIVRAVASKEEFVTAYTPYQAEVSQGLLQSIFEYQTMICELTGMDAANASVYDGATAAAEAVAMCVSGARGVALAAATAHPAALGTMKTYRTSGELALIPAKGGRVDIEALKGLLGANTACVYVQSPNYYGLIEDVAAIAEAAHAAGAKVIVSANPIACALYKSPGELGADIAVGDGQPLGLGLNFGGPSVGFMAARTAMMRKLPGRIVGQTTDLDGERAFVLTLQAREQHIRREKASSNICSNEALCALTAGAYMAALGAEGLADVARQCHAKAAYLAEGLAGAGYALRYGGEFFNEFVTELPVCRDKLLSALSERDILGGLPLEGGMLWCATELNSRSDMDEVIAIAREAAK